jgi:NAD(P)-dependent dehydrogenase (short-subunit alcohol dehydrogenase family)
MSEAMRRELKTLFSQQQPIKRAGMPEDIAKAVLWFASDEASFVTGHPLVVDGGISLGHSASFLQAFITQLNAIRQRE